jgi:predicted HTH transcriptional regulator
MRFAWNVYRAAARAPHHMNTPRLIDLVNDLLGRGEAAWVEFKQNNTAPETIGVLASAISNAARLSGQQTGYILWGVEDATHSIIGTAFDPEAHRVGNQVFSLWLAQRLSPSIAFQFHAVPHPLGRVVLMEIPAATSAPVHLIAWRTYGSAAPRPSLRTTQNAIRLCLRHCALMRGSTGLRCSMSHRTMCCP